MKTLIKKEWEAHSHCSAGCLENGAEITALIQTAALLACPCCGNPATIRYTYCKDTPTHPHRLQGICADHTCWLQTNEWLAADDEADFKAALRRIVEVWNRRPE